MIGFSGRLYILHLIGCDLSLPGRRVNYCQSKHPPAGSSVKVFLQTEERKYFAEGYGILELGNFRKSHICILFFSNKSTIYQVLFF